MIQEAFKLDNQLCFRLYTASRLLTQAYHPILSQEGLTYPQYLVLLVLCDSVTPETAPELFRMLDDIIGKLSAR